MIENSQMKFTAREMRYDQYKDIGLSFLTQPREDHRSLNSLIALVAIALSLS